MISYIWEKSELHVQGNMRPAILADSVEAFIAALYMDSKI